MSFSVTRPLRFGDCDPSGIAYFPSYLNILVGVVEEFFASLGAPWPRLTTEERIGTPTIRLDCTFKSPGMHGMEMLFTIHVRAVGRTSLDLFHEVSHEGQLLWSAEQRLVATSLETHKSCPWPDALRQALSARIETD
ncbi:MAG: 4-hydroxybenzoyl-CoA thioesterase [Mesorhizobium amorphae]|nr:MAG: 4-hydroxybenzoyl-CoA thioesterase [Mesorhizobium amorphae]